MAIQTKPKPFLTKWAETLRLSIAEVAVFALFIFNFIVASVFNLNIGYLSNKRNIFNRWFVKRGWAWTTIILFGFYGVQLANKRMTPRQLMLALTRFIIVSLWWWLFTQWCFGMPIMDKVFIWTGGLCVIDDTTSISTALDGLFSPSQPGQRLLKAVTSYVCRKAKGTWQGGHDPSGHVFLLVQLILLLFMETSSTWLGWKHLWRHVSRLALDFGESPNFKNKAQLFGRFLLSNPHVWVIWLISLWWSMLFMTNAYFHLAGEKIVGLVFSLVAIALVYVVPRWVDNGVLKFLIHGLPKRLWAVSEEEAISINIDTCDDI